MPENPNQRVGRWGSCGEPREGSIARSSGVIAEIFRLLPRFSSHLRSAVLTGVAVSPLKLNCAASNSRTRQRYAELLELYLPVGHLCYPFRTHPYLRGCHTPVAIAKRTSISSSHLFWRYLISGNRGISVWFSSRIVPKRQVIPLPPVCQTAPVVGAVFYSSCSAAG